MKWFTHQTLAAASAVALGMPVAAVGGAVAGAVLPDVIDHRLAALSSNRQRAFNQVHRGASHWFGWYAVLLLAALAAPEFMPGLLAGLKNAGLLPVSLGKVAQGLVASVLAGVAYGALTHVLLDMCTPSGIPLTPFSRKNKLSLHLCSTGSVREYAFLVISLAVLAVLAGDRWRELGRVLQRSL